ncbi:lamin tail domain-containing protein [Deefgea tanakiae]|uniref:Lamin tail domain-containing protein n=1 Tax=Deefgea tanakiae TaxID=2865840 RepID=A0ABX8Z9M7_9NEIS|nr:endonuclease/exonuclease/phosphatase family protein [Deefgea tanakiae]QZA79271.1 lamin tail domain-containing protein [Deefgea tanakiae]
MKVNRIQYKLTMLASSCLLAWAPSSFAAGKMVISQIYGGGGNSAAVYKNDFVELLNVGDADVDITNWSVQYASAAGTNWAVTTLPAIQVKPGQYILVQLGSNGVPGDTLPQGDKVGTQNISATTGKVVLVNLSSSISSVTAPSVQDLVGYGSNASLYEGTGAAAAPSNSTAIARTNDGCNDTNDNKTDFVVSAPKPRNSSSPIKLCSIVTPPDGGGNTGGNTGGPATVRIHEIQGSKHRSPLEGRTVLNVPGIVTLVTPNGFYLQDPQTDNDVLTSEGVFVYTKTFNAIVGDSVQVTGVVKEYRPGGAGGSNNLSTTEIDANAANSIYKVSSGNALPKAIVLGSSVPKQVIWQGPAGDIEQTTQLNLSNGLDYFESMEGMLVQVDGAQVVGPTQHATNETPIVPNYAMGSNLVSPRGGVVITQNNRNPQRLILANGSATVSRANVGDSFAQAVGVIDYAYANYQLLATYLSPLSAKGLQPEVTRDALADELSVASFNVENLDPADGQAKLTRLANQIVKNLKSPDVVGLMEIQDGNGATNNGMVSAEATMAALTNAIRSAGGPNYSFRQIDPSNNQDGGEPGGNIRPVIMYNPSRVGFVDRVGGSATTATLVSQCTEIACLSTSPGRIDPNNAAFNSSRKPLVAELMFNGHKLFVVANHFNSKGGDQPIGGRFQPPVLSSEVQRNKQADIVASFVTDIRNINPNAKVVVLGDLNDYQFSTPVAKLKAAGLVDLVEKLPENERYTYVFEGNSQVLDHIMATENLSRVADYDIVHVNAEFADQASDHEPEVVRFNLPQAWRDVSAQVTQIKSGLTYSLKTKTYNGTLTLNAANAMQGPFKLVINGLPNGVSLANKSETIAAGEYIEIPALVSGKTILNLQFNNPNKVAVNYSASLLQPQINY